MVPVRLNVLQFGLMNEKINDGFEIFGNYSSRVTGYSLTSEKKA